MSYGSFWGGFNEVDDNEKEKYIDEFIEFVNSVTLAEEKKDNLNKRAEEWFEKHYVIDMQFEMMGGVETLYRGDKKHYGPAFRELKRILNCMNEEEYARFRKYLKNKLNKKC